MVRRIFRWFALALLGLCVLAWAWSYWQRAVICYYSKPDFFTVGVQRGRLFIQDETHSIEFLTREGWWWGLFPAEGWAAWDSGIAHVELLGFTFGRKADALSSYSGVTLPLWFLTVLSGAFAFFLWRKPRHKAGGFPMEAKEKESTPT